MVLAATLISLPVTLAGASPEGASSPTSHCSDSDMEALQWLDRMVRSADQANYHGVVTLQRQGEDMQVMQVASSVDDGASSERLTQLTGQGAEVQRPEHPLQCIHPGHRLLLLQDALASGECGLAEHYRFQISEGSRVAGRRAVRLEATPRDLYRYGYVLELDRDTGLLLRSETIDRDHRVLEKYQFADLTYDGRAADGAEISLVHEAHHPGPESPAAQKTVSSNWSPHWLPKGFTPTDAPPDNGSRKTFTDGLAVFSVFVEELERPIRPGEGMKRAGSTTVYTRGMEVDQMPVLVTVIGEIPVNTARMVADSLRWSQ